MLKPGILRGSENFSKVYNKGRSVGDRYVVVFFMKNGLDHNRIAFLASKKVGNAVTRNRARRLMKESVRTSKSMERINSNTFLNKTGYDIILIARKTIVGKKCSEVKKSIEHAISRTDLAKKQDIEEKK